MASINSVVLLLFLYATVLSVKIVSCTVIFEFSQIYFAVVFFFADRSGLLALVRLVQGGDDSGHPHLSGMLPDL